MTIYMITNLITNKRYIGQTRKSIKERFRRHYERAYYSKENLSYLHQSIKKYGKDNFTIEIIEETENLNEREIFYIKSMNTKYPNGYNIRIGGENTELTEKHIKNMSKCYKVTNSHNSESFYFCGTKSTGLPISKSCVSYAIKNGNTYLGYFWELVDRSEFEKNKIEDLNLEVLIKCIAINESTGDVIHIKENEKYTDYGFCSSKVGPILKGEHGRHKHKGYNFYSHTDEDKQWQIKKIN